MRIVLISTVMLMSAVPIFAQDLKSDVNVQNPSAMMSKQPLVNPPASTFANPSRAADVSADTPVVTLDGVCEQPIAAGKKDCKTVLTRARIDRLIDMLAPESTPAARRRFAVSYARLLAASGVAQTMHIEKDPAVAGELQAQLDLVRMEVLANTLYHQMQERSANVPMADIQKYYLSHTINFNEGDVRRLAIPLAAPTKNGQPLDAAAVRAKMEELRVRAAKGEDFDKLQEEAYGTFEIEIPSAPTQLSMVRRTKLLPGEDTVFDLHIGEVTPILESEGALIVLKLESKHAVPFETAQPEIKAVLQQERMAQELQAAAKNVKAEFNLAYLGMPSAPELFLPPATAQPLAAKALTSDSNKRTSSRRRMTMNTPRPR